MPLSPFAAVLVSIPLSFCLIIVAGMAWRLSRRVMPNAAPTTLLLADQSALYCVVAMPMVYFARWASSGQAGGLASLLAWAALILLVWAAEAYLQSRLKDVAKFHALCRVLNASAWFLGMYFTYLPWLRALEGSGQS